MFRYRVLWDELLTRSWKHRFFGEKSLVFAEAFLY